MGREKREGGREREQIKEGKGKGERKRENNRRQEREIEVNLFHYVFHRYVSVSDSIHCSFIPPGKAEVKFHLI